jgi:hypothetical protein
MEYIIGIIVALLGLLGYNYTKRKSAEALNENLETKEKVNEEAEHIARDVGLVQVEEERRKQIEKEINDAKEKEDSLKDISDFFNKPKP